MPIWNYRCSECDHVEEIIQLGKNDSDAARPSKCPKCETWASFQLVVMPLGRMHFKGPGFYVNDYKPPRKQDTKTTHALGAPRGDDE
jgi:putative FmdB family regulatory protein